MKVKLFNQKISPLCEYCLFSKISDQKNFLFCNKKGLVDFDFSCSKFHYNPLKRKPKNIVLDKKYTNRDFSLD